MRERLPCVYILASGVNGTLYVGVTSNLIGRVIQHREGTFDGFTRRYGVYRLVWFEVGESMEAAIAREKQVKRYRRNIAMQHANCSACHNYLNPRGICFPYDTRF
ncbi:GIY-YIG nuclease family protein [Sphingomonas koreensis]|uniref:GIY-YIG nuclease family protein n=1 Tax=Sphingomonas koreensis TaxID=93064 RepID=UPI0008334616|nr:GIY-YIG nuclease family protein [Sphingomonas koreensis]PJI88543.1 putative endonuclease [Sphingomonas koreensis]RSU58866.1 GIY-YIG nuclease family protein [Sphingomonas koreensis]RSU67232.1 GIY-YIG nuclease family protein [Sphingomonas koreensis]